MLSVGNVQDEKHGGHRDGSDQALWEASFLISLWVSGFHSLCISGRVMFSASAKWKGNKLTSSLGAKADAKTCSLCELCEPSSSPW